VTNSTCDDYLIALLAAPDNSVGKRFFGMARHSALKIPRHQSRYIARVRTHEPIDARQAKMSQLTFLSKNLEYYKQYYRQFQAKLISLKIIKMQ